MKHFKQLFSKQCLISIFLVIFSLSAACKGDLETTATVAEEIPERLRGTWTYLAAEDNDIKTVTIGTDTITYTLGNGEVLRYFRYLEGIGPYSTEYGETWTLTLLDIVNSSAHVFAYHIYNGELRVEGNNYRRS